MLRFSLSPSLGAAALAAALATVGAQQSEVSVSPFVTFLPTGSASPMAGLAFTITGGPLALRASGHISIQDRPSLTTPASTTTTTTTTTTSTTTTTTAGASTTRPWGADADVLTNLDTYALGDHIGFMPYVFAGVSTAGVDSGARRFNRQGWSYGGGINLPVASALVLFGEARWRMSRFVMPDATDAPPTTHEFRVGVSFHIGHGSSDVLRSIPPSDVEPDADSPKVTVGGTSRLLSTASQFVGTPYRRGGTSPSSGFDASGFVRFVFSQLGVQLPRTSRDQARVGQNIRPDWRSIAPGDLLMFEDDGGINHVAIYVGSNRIIHSSASGGGVRYDDLSSERGQWFVDHLVAARRVTPDLRGLLLDLARGYANDLPYNSDGPDHAPRAAFKRRP